MKLSEFLARRGIDASFFERDGKVNFGLWHKEAKYSVLIERFGQSQIIASLLEDDKSFYNGVVRYNSVERSIVSSFDEFLKKWDSLEEKIYPDRKVEMWRKPFVLWEKLEELL